MLVHPMIIKDLSPMGTMVGGFLKNVPRHYLMYIDSEYFLKD